ncbi:F-box only protein 5 [Thalassophryne amazonica]|uniref:F-box only protein 5 n=1 Tax=Thalassophryne amazonica TaxID=390379 RepID=UPI001470B3CC|nr:F-box only protein 5 [Thalassophryne amazonica]
MSHNKNLKMKHALYEAAGANIMEKSRVVCAESKVFDHKTSPLKELTPIKPLNPPESVTTVLFLPCNDTRVGNKENGTNWELDRTLDEHLEDSGYLSLRNSQTDLQGEEEDEHNHRRLSFALPLSDAATPQEKSPRRSQKKRSSLAIVAPSTPTTCLGGRTLKPSQSSTPSSHHDDSNLPMLKFEQIVCKELAKSFQKNKRYDWSIVSKLAEDFHLERVIGRQMGLEYIDMFSSLLSMNMRHILTRVLALLGDMDLISCKKVSRTWRKIICEDRAALRRCEQAEQALAESGSTRRPAGCTLTRDVAVSRVVLSSMQTLASTSKSTSSSSAPSSSSIVSCRVNRRATSSQKSNTPNAPNSRFDQFVQVAGTLKRGQSLRRCRRCGSPAIELPVVQRATCTRQSCLFDFCTCCQEAFHGSSPCRVVQPRSHFHTVKTDSIIPGSAHSRRNIRRL